MNEAELQLTFVDSCKVGASYCRTSHEKGGVCILVQDGLRFTSYDLAKFCQDKDFEDCACRIYSNSKRIYIIAVYRAPSGNLDLFFTKLDNILKYLYTPTFDIIICGDININYLVNSAKKSQLEALLKTNNLESVFSFPTRIQQKSATAIDNIFLDISKIRNYSTSPITNGLSDHDAQSITLHSIGTCGTRKKCILIGKINKCSINDFIHKLSHENWDLVFSSDDVNVEFNSFLDSYLKIFHSSFPLKKIIVSPEES
jgi:hypothetical protein